MKSKSSAVNELKYLKVKESDRLRYTSNSEENVLHPFSLDIESMQKLLLFDIEDEPMYEALELQEFNDEVSKGLVILL